MTPSALDPEQRYLLGEMNPEEVRKFEESLRGDEPRLRSLRACREALADVRADGELLDFHDGAEAREQETARFVASEQDVAIGGPLGSRRRLWHLAAAAALVLGVGLLVVHLSGRSGTSRPATLGPTEDELNREAERVVAAAPALFRPRTPGVFDSGAQELFRSRPLGVPDSVARAATPVTLWVHRERGARVVLLSPLGCATDTTPDFVWRAVPGAAEYTLSVVSVDGADTPPPVTVAGAGEMGLMRARLSRPLSARSYAVRVLVHLGDGALLEASADITLCSDVSGYRARRAHVEASASPILRPLLLVALALQEGAWGDAALWAEELPGGDEGPVASELRVYVRRRLGTLP